VLFRSIVEKSLLIKNKSSSSEDVIPNNGYSEIFFDTDLNRLSYRNSFSGLRSIENDNIFSIVFRKNDNTEYIKTKIPHDVAARFIYEGEDIQSLNKLSIIASTKSNTASATFDLTDFLGKTVYCSLTVDLTKVPTIYNIFSFSDLPNNQSLFLFRFGPTSGKSEIKLFFASLR